MTELPGSVLKLWVWRHRDDFISGISESDSCFHSQQSPE